MNLARDAGAGEPDDEDSLAALLAVLAVLGADAGTSDARSADGRSGGEALARWRARRMAALGVTLPEADGVRPPRRHA